MKKTTSISKKLNLNKKHIFTLTPEESRGIAGGAGIATLITFNKICELQSDVTHPVRCGTQIILPK